MQELRIIVDQRERNSELIEGLVANGLTVDVMTIPVGDYIISERVCIERKTVSDFESSMMNGRLFEQLGRLKSGYEFPMVIVEGDHNTFRLKKKVINGAIAAIYLDQGIPVLFSHGPEDTADIITSIAKMEQEGGRRPPSLKGAARAHTAVQFQEFVVGNLPGVGPKLAKALLVHFKSVKNMANATVEELTGVEMIGKKKAEKIHDILNAHYEP